ncbi:MAG: hypothetical protein [Xiangshan Nyami-like virus]|uniref:Nucleoprotein n=1 Tax=Xiangshan Nyami-like virus TaxID=2886229 RepID=A0A8K1YQM6_9MONO|nr:MAG: hypothetical protein QKV38_gp1 [Xiangshan Nyami-like virus]UDL13956.1 MAG: hypothetical protein [Xiangshan Nyami-like virus]
MSDIPIERTIRSIESENPYYYDPYYTLLGDAIESMSSGECFATCICWFFGRRPDFMIPKIVTLSSELAVRYQAAKASAISDQYLLLQAVAGLMTIAKEVRTGKDGNVEYLEKRWKALCATQGIENALEKGVFKMNQLVEPLQEWQAYIKPRTALRSKFINYVVEGLPAGSPGLLVAALDQVRMVLKEWGLKSILCMDSFIATKNRALELAPIAQQAVDMRKNLARLRDQYKDMFPYIKLYPLKGAETLHHREYPDLYYAAIKEAILSGDLGKEGRYLMTEVQTTIPRSLIDETCEKKVRARQTIGEQTKLNLEYLGYEIDYEDDRESSPPPPKRRR